MNDATVHHRVTAARAAYGRLRTCLYYALDSSGVTINGLQQDLLRRLGIEEHKKALDNGVGRYGIV